MQPRNLSTVHTWFEFSIASRKSDILYATPTRPCALTLSCTFLYCIGVGSRPVQTHGQHLSTPTLGPFLIYSNMCAATWHLHVPRKKIPANSPTRPSCPSIDVNLVSSCDLSPIRPPLQLQPVNAMVRSNKVRSVWPHATLFCRIAASPARRSCCITMTTRNASVTPDNSPGGEE